MDKRKKSNWNPNPKGNPNIKNAPKPGPITKEGKLRSLISTGNLRPHSKSRTLNYFKICDRCPLRPRIETRFIGNKEKKISIASKCPHYKEGQKCVIPQKEFIKELDYYFKHGEEEDMMALQKAMAYKALEYSEIAKETEMLQSRKPGFYSLEWFKAASEVVDKHNKITQPQKIQSENVNHNIDWTEAIIKAYEKDAEEDKEEK